MGTSHQEPMLRAQKEWDRSLQRKYGNWNYNNTNQQPILQQFWREGIRRNKNFESIITLGLRMQNGTGAHIKETLQGRPFLRELQETENGMQLYVDRGEEVLPEVLRLLDNNGTTIRTVTLARPTLEDVFLRLTGRSLREEQSA